MNFTKFHVSVGNAYYKSFNEWYSCNPRTVGQFLHSVVLLVQLPPSMQGQLSVIAEHQTRVGELEPLQRDYFCCFMASKSSDHLSYGEQNSATSNLRWQRTTLKVDTSSEIHVRATLCFPRSLCRILEP